MSLLERARADVKRIIENDEEWGVAIEFASPSDSEFDGSFEEAFRGAGSTAAVTGTHTKHHQSFDLETGKDLNAKKASVTVVEQALTDLDYPVRENGEVDLKDHLVRVKDSTGTEYQYVVDQWFPDEALGLIVCILGKYE